MISKEKKQAIIAQYARTPGDTGSPEVQIAVLTERIAELKMPDLNAASLEAAMSMIAGTARSMGVNVEQ